MDVTPLIPADRQLIQSYGDGGFRVSGVRHSGSVLIFPDRTLAWTVADIKMLSAHSLSAVAEAEPRVEVLLIGCGARTALIPSAVRASLKDKGVVIDAMDTGAACRTYNVLLSESRRVAAALIAV
jgi:uncharacterized protein